MDKAVTICNYCGAACNECDVRTSEHLLSRARQGICTQIGLGSIDLLPSRNDFIDKEFAKETDALIAAGKPILFLPNTVQEQHEQVGTYGELRYVIYLYGVIPDGRKCCVVLEDIMLNLDVMVPAGCSTNEFKTVLCKELGERNGIKYKSTSIVQLFPLHGFNTHPRDYVRLTFSNLIHRRRAIEFINERNKKCWDNQDYAMMLSTASDDYSSYSTDYYFPKVAREYKFNTADWNKLNGYTRGDVTKDEVVCLRVNVVNFRRVGRKEKERIKQSGGKYSAIIDRDPLIVQMWDIETYRTIQNGCVPTIHDTDFTIFTVCAAYFLHYSAKPLLTVCLIDGKCDPHPGINVVVQCESEEELLRAWVHLAGKMLPDITGAFNGGCFDTPLVCEKLFRAGLLINYRDALSALRHSMDQYGKPARGETQEIVRRRFFRRCRVKIAPPPEEPHTLSAVARIPGVLDIDVMPIFLMMYPRAEVRKAESLNFFLAKDGLSSKEDMHYKRMFKIYERSLKLRGVTHCHCGDACGMCTDYEEMLDTTPTPKCCFCDKVPRNRHDMSLVAYYCAIDCIRPQELCVKRMVITDKRELSTASYMALYDSFYRANGVKVRNFIGAFCHKNGTAFSNARSFKQPRNKEHYPGGWVFPPNRGLNNRRPITGLDFASLYPSIMMAYNRSIDMIVRTEEEARKLAALGYTLHRIIPFRYEIGEKRGAIGNEVRTGTGWTVGHNGIINPARDKYAVSEYEKVVTIRARVNDLDICFDYVELGGIGGYLHIPTCPFTGERLDNCGLSSAVRGVPPLRLLAIKAAGVKHSRQVTYRPVLGRPALPGERMGTFSYIVKKLFDKRVPIKREFVRLSERKEEMTLAGIPEDSPEFADLIFNLNKVELTQKAIKVLANTFYGESGNYISPVYELLVAAGVTTSGQYNIKLVAEETRRLGFKVEYGDTDSLYLECPDRVYTNTDRKYAASARTREDKLAHWTEMVRVTMNEMNLLREYVSDFLLADNGTTFLNMAYEEVGFPTVFCGKKKYFMTAHRKEINFFQKEVFIRGIDIIKQGQTQLTKHLGEEFMERALSIDNNQELIDIAYDTLHRAVSSRKDWPAEWFVRAATYRTNRDNRSVKRFVARMTQLYAEYMQTDPVKAALYQPPEPGDKIFYVVVKRDTAYSLRGTQIKYSKGDCMEYFRVWQYSQGTGAPLEIDFTHYLGAGIIGLFARFIAYHPMFQPGADAALDPAEDYSSFDEACVSKASKHLEELCNRLTGRDAKRDQDIGRGFQSAYRAAAKSLCASALKLHGSMYPLYAFSEDVDPRVVVNGWVDSAVIRTAAGYGEKYVEGLRARGWTQDRLALLGKNEGYLRERRKEIAAGVRSAEHDLQGVLPRYCMAFRERYEAFKNLITSTRDVAGGELLPEDVAEHLIAEESFASAAADVAARARRLAALRSVELLVQSEMDAVLRSGR